MQEGPHHLNTRKRIYKNLEPYPHPIRWKRYLDQLMYFVGIATPLVLIPQLLQVWVSHNTAGVSILTWFLFGLIDALWVFYGIAHRAKALIISNFIMMALNFLVAIGVLILR